MDANWLDRRTLIIIVTSVAVGVFISLVGLLPAWSLLQAAGIPTYFWTMIEALATAVPAAAVAIAGVAAYYQLAEAAKGRHIEIANRLFEELNSFENIAARRWIFQNLKYDPEKGIQPLEPEGRDAVKRVLNSLDHVAFLTQAGWIPEEMVMPWMNPMIVKAWAKLEPYVDYESKRRHEPDYYEHARELAERCVAWRANNLPDAKITWVDDTL